MKKFKTYLTREKSVASNENEPKKRLNQDISPDMNVHQTPFFPTENSKANSGQNSLTREKDDLNARKEYPRTTSENIHIMLNGDKSLGINPLNGVRILEKQNHSAGVSTPTLENDQGSIGSTE